MKITTLDDFRAFLRVCHDELVHSVEVDGIKLQLVPRGTESDRKQPGPGATVDDFTGGMPTGEEMMFWSSTKPKAEGSS